MPQAFSILPETETQGFPLFQIYYSPFQGEIFGSRQ